MYHDFIDKKIGDVQAVTASAGCPNFVNREAPELSTLQPVSVEDVIKAIKSASGKQCATDPLPTWLSTCTRIVHHVPVQHIADQWLLSNAVEECNCQASH